MELNELTKAALAKALADTRQSTGIDTPHDERLFEVGFMLGYAALATEIRKPIVAHVYGVYPTKKPTAALKKRCAALLKDGSEQSWITAIKEWRNATGLGLKESKDAIDAMRLKIRGF
jgi:hypothetical protein